MSESPHIGAGVKLNGPTFIHPTALNYARSIDRLRPGDLDQLRRAAAEASPS